MGTWDCVETDFGSDETGNFGPRQESGSALYEVNTIATIATREQEMDCGKPHLSCTVIGERTCVAANQHLSVFKDLQFCQTLEFSFPIDVMAWSPDEVFIVLGDSQGSLFFLEPESLIIIYSTDMLPPNKTGEKTFRKIIVRKIKDGYDIAILSSCSQMFVIRGATPAAFMESSKSLQERFNIEIVDTSDVHTKETHSILFLEDNIVTLGSGDNIIGVWASEDGRLELIDVGDSFLAQDAGIVSGYSTANNRFLILLDEKHRITVWNASMLILLTVWEEAKVESFFLLETDKNNNSKSLADIKVVMLTNESGTSCLQVKTLPGWETVYRLELLPTLLADAFPNQESLYILEWCDKDENKDVKASCLRVRCLTEALPETRLTRLLNKNLFDEAMEFAKLFRLDTELIYKVKCKYLLDQLSSWNVGKYQPGEIKEMTDNLHTCLAAVKDVPFIVSGLTNVALPSLEDTHKILLYVKKRMLSHINSPDEMSDGQKKKCKSDLNKLFGAIYRLTTFKQAFGQRYYSAERWERFLSCNLLEQVFIWLRHGDLPKSLGIWTRHQHDWECVLTPGVLTELLAAIPEDVKTSQLISWLTLDLIPFTLTSLPKALDILLKWIIQKALNMEQLEKDNWPVNAINFLRSVHQSGVQAAHINSAHKETTPSETVLRTQVNVVEALQSVHSQIVKLEHLNDLRKNYKFYLTYNQFEQESTESVTFRMLDKVVAIELIASVLKKQIRPYMIEHGLKDDDIFFKYIKDLLERSGCGQTYHGEAPWEAKAVAVIKYIKNPELKCEAIHDVMKYASLPWTAEIQGLVQSGLKLDHPKVELLKDQCSMTRIKEILLKYELKKVKVESLGSGDITRLICFILSKDQKSSVADALEIIELKSLGHCYKVDLYLFRLRYLIQEERGGEALTLIRQLPAYLSVTCAKRLVKYTEVVMNEPIRYNVESEEKMKRLFSRAGSKACSYLMESLKDRAEVERYTDVKAELENILALQLEFGEVVTLTQYQNSEKRDIILKNLLQKIFMKNKKEKTLMCYSKVFRLADILRVRRARLLGQLAIHAATSGQVDRAVDLCNLLLESEPTQQTGDTVYEVTCSISHIHSASPDDVPVELLRRLPQVLNELACQAAIICSPDLLNKCLMLCRVMDLSRKLCSQCESGDYSLSVQAGDATSQDSYTVWNLDTMFREDALVLDSRTALPLTASVTTSHLELVDFCSDNAAVHEEEVPSDTLAEEASSLLTKFASTTQNLTSYLLKNGHVGLSLDYFQQMINISTQFVLQQDMGYPVKDEIVRKVVDHQRQTLYKLYPVGLARTKELTSSLVLKVLNERRVDQRLGLAYLTSLPAPQSIGLLKKSASSSKLNYKALASIAQVGIALSGLTRDPTSLSRFQELEQNATWGHRLSKFKISFREAFMAPAHEKTKLLSTMAQCEAVDINFIKDFCRAFQIEEDHGLFLYLDHLLLSPPPLKLDPEALQQQQAQLGRARSAIHDITMKDQLRDRLQNILEQINPYNYEVIQFILEEILKLSPVSMETTEKGLNLLKHLRYYRRCAPITEFEIKCSVSQESEELVRGIDCLHPLSKNRLPYHPLMSEKPMKVIKPEINYTTVSLFESMAHQLQISSNSVYMAAIKNTVQQFIEVNSSRVTPGVDVAKEKQHCKWELDAAGVELLKKVREMIMKLSSCEIALACCVSSVIGALPIGAEKVAALKQCVDYAEMWYKASPSDSPDREKAMTAYTKFLEFYRRLSTEQVLYQTQMAEADLLQLTTNPKALLNKLYQHPTILLHDGEIEGSRPDIHDIAEKIASIHSLELSKIIKNLIMEWLPGGGATEEIDATMTFNFTNLDFAKDESVSENEESLLRRVIYLLQFEPLKTSCQSLYHFVTNSQIEGMSRSNECHVRALRCLLELADDKTIESVCTQPASEIRQRLQILMYLVELEGLHIQHTVETFSQCNKEGLVKGIWQNHSHMKSAVQLVANLCLDYQIYDILLWNSLLQKLQAFSMMTKLENLLVKISGVKALWQIPSLSKTWQDLLLTSLTKGVPPLEGEDIEGCAHAINLLMKCPTPEELNLSALSDQCCRQEMYGCALCCVMLMMDHSEQIKHVQTVMSVGLTAVLKSLASAEKHGLLATAVRRVEEILFVYTEMTADYEEMYQSERQQAFIRHLVDTDQIDGILEYFQQKNRLDEANNVVEVYLKSSPSVTPHIRAACAGQPVRTKLQIFMAYLDNGFSPQMNGSL